MQGAVAPKLVTGYIVRKMSAGLVIVDVVIDQGGCRETSTPTCHDKPCSVKHGIIHYCVTNMPGAAARTSIPALNNVYGLLTGGN